MTLFTTHKSTGVRAGVSQLVNRVLVNTAREQERQAFNPPQPPLNLLTTTPWNVSRLIVRLGPVVQVCDTVRDLVRWTDPVKTVLLMLAWVTLCYYPTMLCVTPNLFVILVIMRNHHMQKNQFFREASQTSSTGALGSAWSTSIAVGSEQYVRNMQYCDAFDSLVTHSRVLDWSHPQTTSRILQWSMISIPIVWLIYFAVPFNYVLLVAGVAGFLHKTTGVRAQRVLGAPFVAIPALGRRMSSMINVLKGLDPMGLQNGGAGTGVLGGGPPIMSGGSGGGGSSGVGAMLSDSAAMMGEALVGGGAGMVPAVMRPSPIMSLRNKAPSPRQLPNPAPVTVSLFENQRWWAGPGWIAHLLSQERTPWSDAAGTVAYPPPTEYQVPQGWAWVDDWRIDGEWFATDSEGWVYSDHKWMMPTPHAGLNSLTRRRRWVRTMLQGPKQTRGMR
ncbi:peroxisome- protein [Geranomyces variabilis]|uniref:Peroxisome- protein n=1 Tax=Geranomyces variabilis TaxID=109894 RepID=A0AAD5THB2_9FUNG|nr:peroxisome- protein [Geranomyces variabilis]